ncbi:hypothetical protein JTB14_036897 [Gonioctena quinquepunctata]|nr:hypothetical protein JTB14_036897 [Gonioctena quinquepunctata]
MRVLPHSVINYDETNIIDDSGREKKVVRRECRHPGRIIVSSKSSTSVMPGTAHFFPHIKLRIFIIPGPNMALRRQFIIEVRVDGSLWRYSKTGFEKLPCPIFRSKIKKGKKVMIGDNLASHISPYMIEECKTNNIIFILLLPNSTGLTQQLDVAFFRFRLLKKCLEALGKENISKNLMSGFKGAGLIPLNREEVLKRVPGKKVVEEGKKMTILLGLLHFKNI